MKIRIAAAAAAAIVPLAGCGATTVVSTDAAGVADPVVVGQMVDLFYDMFDPMEQESLCAYWSSSPTAAWSSFNRGSEGLFEQIEFDTAMVQVCS